MKRAWFSFGVLALVALPAMAQQSASYRQEEGVFHNGGRPDGVSAGSLSFRISIESLGEGLARSALAGPSFSLDSGFVPAYPPPVEVKGLLFKDAVNLVWESQPPAVEYNLYRDGLTALPDDGFGACHQPALLSTTTFDPDLPPPGEGLFYLVTAVNRLDEEGPKGVDSVGVLRTGILCP